MRNCFALAFLLCALAAPRVNAQITPAFGETQLAGKPQIARLARAYAAETANEEYVLESTTVTEWDGTGWVNVARTRHDYDAKARLESQSESWTGVAWAPETRIINTYSGGLLTAQTYGTFEGGALEPSERFTYTYPTVLPQQPVITPSAVVHEYWNGERWDKISRDEFTGVVLGGQWAVTGGTTFGWNGQMWQPASRFTLYEDETDVIQLDETWTSGFWQNSSRTKFIGYTIGSLNARLRMIQSLLGDYESIVLSLIFLPDHISQEYTGSTWVTTFRQTTDAFHYSSGYPMEVTSFSFEGDWVPVSKMKATYTVEGYPVQIAAQVQLDDESWHSVMAESYTVNGSGNILTATHQLDLGNGLQTVSQVTYRWRNLATSVDDDDLPTGYALDAAYPNPFNPSTQITYHLDQAGPVSVRIYDALGRTVATLVDATMPAGTHRATFEAFGYASGTYHVRLEAPGFQQSRLITLVK